MPDIMPSKHTNSSDIIEIRDSSSKPEEARNAKRV